MAKEKITPREVNGSPSTERVAYRYNELLTKEAYIDSERAELYTEYIKKHWKQSSPAEVLDSTTNNRPWRWGQRCSNENK